MSPPGRRSLTTPRPHRVDLGRIGIGGSANSAWADSVRSYVSLAHEAARAGGEAAVALVGADHDERRALATPRHADGVLRALESPDDGPLQGRLNDLTRQNRPGRFRTVHLELTAAHGGLHRHTLLAVEKLSLADTSRRGDGDNEQQRKGSLHLMSVLLWHSRQTQHGRAEARLDHSPQLVVTALPTLHQRVANVGTIGTHAIEQEPVADDPARAGTVACRCGGFPGAIGAE